MSKAVASIVEVKRQIRALEAVGKCVASVRYFADGGFELLTPSTSPADADSHSGDWGDDAGKETLSRA